MMKKSNSFSLPSPPRLAEWIFSRLFPDSRIFTTLGDLEEIFRGIAAEKGLRNAHIWYWRQLFKAIPHRIAGFIFMDIPMFTLSLKIMARNLRKNKVFFFLNIFALTLGLSCFLLIFIYTRYELTYDSFHPDHQSIYRVRLQSSQESERPSVGFPLAPALESQFPEIELAAQFCYAFGPVVKIENRLYSSTGKFADENFLKLFHFPIRRAVDRPLAEPYSVILTESASIRFFGSEDPMGKTLSFIIRGEPCELTVTGILADPPRNTHFDFDLLISFSTTESLPEFKALMEAVSYQLTATYIKIHENASARDCEEKISGLLTSHCDLQPITDIHLLPDNKDNNAIRSLFLYLSLGVIILIIACINYVNLATARSSIRMREIGIRKTIGAQRRQLVRQFIGEALILTGISFVVSIILLWFSLPVFNRLLNKDIGLSMVLKSSLWLETLGIVLFIGISSGAYPAVFLSSFKPVQILKGMAHSSGRTESRPSRLRNVLVVMQFTVSVVLICVMLFIHQQVRYIKTMDTGFDRSEIVEAWVPDNAAAVKDELLRNSKILNVTMASNAVTLSNRKNSGEEFGDNIRYVPAPGSPEEFRAHHVQCDSAFLDVFSIPLISGRNFSDKLNEDRSVIINETFACLLGPDSAIAKRIQIQRWADDEERWRDFFVVGIVKDFHHQPLTQTIKPLMLTHTGSNFMSLYAKIRDEDTAGTMAFIQQTVRAFNPDRFLPIGFLDERISGIYKAEENQGVLLSVFSAMAVLIACLGLFGLAAFTAERKTREIGIRKVLGAQTGQLFLMLSKDLGLLLALANVMGWPLGYYFVSRWMANFAYHVPILPWTFIWAGVFVLVAILITSGTQIIRVSRSNPADILRHE
jgi:putative ABC transport system permease protein